MGDCLDFQLLRRLFLERCDRQLGDEELSTAEAATLAVISERLIPSIYFLLLRDEVVYSNFTCVAVPSMAARLRLKLQHRAVADRMRSRGRCMHAISETLEYMQTKFGAESREDFRSSTHPEVFAQVSAALLLLFSIPGDSRLQTIFKKHENLAKLLDVKVWTHASGNPEAALQGFRTSFERPVTLWDKLFPKTEPAKSPDWQRKLFVFGSAVALVAFVMSGNSVLGTGDDYVDEYAAEE